MTCEPTRLEMFLTRLAFFFCGRSVYQTFAQRLPLDGGERVLDFGCGMGTVAYYVAGKLPHGSLTCLDVSRRWLSACRKTLRRHNHIIYLRCQAPMLADESFDVAYCHFVLHDISKSELEEVIPALARALKPGGLLVFREPLNPVEKTGAIKSLIQQSGLSLQESRITDVPLMGNTLESVYQKP